MNNRVPRMTAKQAERARWTEGIKCHADNRKLAEGEPWYETRDGSIVCKAHMMESSMPCAYKGEV